MTWVSRECCKLDKRQCEEKPTHCFTQSPYLSFATSELNRINVRYIALFAQPLINLASNMCRKLVEKCINSQNIINGNEAKSRMRFEPINGIMKPLHIKLSMDPIDTMDTIQDSSSLANRPLASGVSEEANFGRNCTGQPRHRPFASINTLAVNEWSMFSF